MKYPSGIATLNVVLIVGLVIVLGTGLAGAQKLVSSTPANGATEVPVDIGELNFHFDQDMVTDSWSFVVARRVSFPPLAGKTDAPWVNARHCRLKLGKLEPGTTYAVQLNSGSKMGFRAASNRMPLSVTVVKFTTAAAKTGAAPVGGTQPGKDSTIGGGSKQPGKDSTIGGGSKQPGKDSTIGGGGKQPGKDSTIGGGGKQSGKDSTIGGGRDDVDRSTDERLASGARPPCPQGWLEFSNEMLGLHAWVPPGFFVRMRGRSVFSVEKTDGTATAAFMVPLRLRGRTDAARLARNYIKFSARQDKNLQAALLKAGPDRACGTFKTKIGEQAVEGRFLTIIGSNGCMGFVMGVIAPVGRLQSQMPLLNQVVRGFAFSWPKARWTRYRTASMHMEVPVGWQVATTEGRVAKNEIDWEVFHTQNPSAKAFSITPKFCSASMISAPLYRERGYKVAVFQSVPQCITASIGGYIRGARLKSVKPNPLLTRICRQIFGTAANSIQGLGAGKLDISVYDCVAEAPGPGGSVTVAFCCAISNLVISGGYSQTDVWCKGWCAPTQQFLSMSPVLDRIQESHQYSVQYVMRVHKAERGRAETIRKTWAEMNRLDREMNQKHWDTQDAIAEMYGDHWSDMGGYVNEKTGRIEQNDSEHLIRNSNGEIVSREEVQEGVSVEEATVLRDAYSNDYMKGVYGRIEFLDTDSDRFTSPGVIHEK